MKLLANYLIPSLYHYLSVRCINIDVCLEIAHCAQFFHHKRNSGYMPPLSLFQNDFIFLLLPSIFYFSFVVSLLWWFCPRQSLLFSIRGYRGCSLILIGFFIIRHTAQINMVRFPLSNRFSSVWMQCRLSLFFYSSNGSFAQGSIAELHAPSKCSR
ncbi:hypothetical protein V8C42DRAFT_84246 [Trichoderma barbatum]